MKMNTKNNIKVNDVAVWGGHDRKAIEDNNVVYDYYEIPQSIVRNDSAQPIFNIYSGYSSCKLDISAVMKGYVVEVSPTVLQRLVGIVDPIMLKFPRYFLSITDNKSSSITCNSFPEYLTQLIENNYEIEELVSQILQCAITEEEYNQKLEEIKSSI